MRGLVRFVAIACLLAYFAGARGRAAVPEGDAGSDPAPDSGPDGGEGDRAVPPQVTRTAAEERRGGDDEETTRALERALVRRGGLVLRPWSAEIEPGTSYRYDEPSGGRRDSFASSLVFRLGLPRDAQVDLRVPYMLHDRQSGVGARSGLGDVDLGLTKLLLRERAFVPELLATARWKTTTGASGGPVSLGSGANGLQGVLTALKRDDPIVLLGSLYYVWNMRSGDVDLGDAAGAVLGIILAATPETSALLAADVAAFSATRAGGTRVAGTDRLSGILDIGISRIVGRDLLLNLTVGVGITPSAPDFQVEVAMPFRL